MRAMVDQIVATEGQNGAGTPPMTRRLKCRIDPELRPYTCARPEHKPVRRGREIYAPGGRARLGDLLVVNEPKPKASEDTVGVVRGSDRPVVQTHAVV